MQSACETGTVIDDVDPDVDLLNRTVSWDGSLDTHTGYLLCVQASNSAGKSVWAVPQAGDPPTALETFTRPAAPPTPRHIRTKPIPDTNDANEKLAPRWEILTRDDAKVPRNADAFTAKMFHSNASGAKSLVAKDCGANPEGYAPEVVLTGRDEVNGFNVDVPDDGAIERLGFTVKAYLCVQANNGADNGLGVGPWNISPVFNVTKPSGISASSPDTGSIEIKGWKKSWVLSYSYRYTYDDGGTSKTGTAYECQSVNEGTSVATVNASPTPPNSGTLIPSTSRGVTVWADDDEGTCTSGTTAPTGHRLASATVPIS